MVDLSVLIVSYNTKNTTQKCLEELIKSLNYCENLTAEIIVVDNGSTDGSVEEIQNTKYKLQNTALQFKIISNKDNLGFARANNEGLALAEGKYILFLNSDVFIQTVNFDDLIYYLNKNPAVGALTVKVKLPNGKIDMASHRGFPTIWRAFTYFAKLEQILGKLPFLADFFGGYHLRHLDFNTIHEVEGISGAFFLTRKTILDQTGGFDPRFFMYGEDIDLCYQIQQRGLKIIYYPLFTVLHLKYQSGLKKKGQKTKSKTRAYFYDSMRLFYDKYFAAHNHGFSNKLIYFFINLKKKLGS